VTQDDATKHWQRGAQESLRLAELAQGEGSYSLVLFHCQLAVEKALKALYIQEYDASPPPTHNLALLASHLSRAWTKEELRQFQELTDFAVKARYDDPVWADAYATEEHSSLWLQHTHALLSSLLP